MLIAVVVGIAAALGVDEARPTSPDDVLVGELAVLSLALAALIPAAVLTARWVDGRRAGTLASVEGRMRWGWLATCTAVTLVLATPLAVVAVLIDPPDGGLGRVDWGLVGVVALVSVAIVPFQAAGEEVVFRGYLAQALGALVAGPWIPAVALSLLFGFVHGTEQGTWLFVDRSAFGLIVAWLTLRTSGLEAAIALHAVGNVLAYVLVTIEGDLGTAVAGPEVPVGALEVAIDLALVLGLAVLLERLWRRRARLLPPPPAG